MATLFDAIEAKKFSQLRAAADAGEDVNAVNAEGLTPLALAVKVNFMRGIEYLLTLGDTDGNKGKPVNTEQPLKDGTSPLMIAAELDRKTAVEILLGFPSVDVNYANAGEDTALHIAVRSGSMKSFGVLIEAIGLNVNKSNSVGETPLYLAAVGGNGVAVEALLQKGADANAGTGAEDPPGVPLTVARLALRQKFHPVINRMIRNMVNYGLTYNAPPTSEVTKLESFEDVQFDVYPRTKKADDLLDKIGELRSPYTIVRHNMEESKANQVNFFKSYSLVRHMCEGLEMNYVAKKLSGVDMYVTLTHGVDKRLLGFFFVELIKGNLLLTVICTRNTVKGAGVVLMNFLMSLAHPSVVKKIVLDSVESAKGFYERLGFKEEERKDKNFIAETWPMSYDMRTGASGRGAGAGAGNTTRRNTDAAGGAGAGGTSAHGGRRRKTRRVLRRRK